MKQKIVYYKCLNITEFKTHFGVMKFDSYSCNFLFDGMIVENKCLLKYKLKGEDYNFFWWIKKILKL